MSLIKIFKRNEKGSITLMVLAAMIFVLVVITASYFAISNKSGNQDKKISKIAQQYRASDEDMEQEYQKVVSNLKVEDYVKVGDYVDYNPTIATKDGQSVDANKLKYTSPTGTAIEHGNGYTSAEEGGGQTFTAKANDGTDTGLKWRVLSVSDDKVELMSEKVVQTDANTNFILQGGIGYLYAEQELNEICKIYGYGYGADTTKGGTYTTGGPIDTPTTKKIEGTGARSITIEDINKKAGIYEDKADGKMKDSAGTVVDSSYGTTTNPTSDVFYPTVNGNSTTGMSTSPGVKSLKYTYYYYYNNSKIENPDIQQLINEEYWLASRCVKTDSGNAYFCVRAVGDNYTWVRNFCRTYSSYWNDYDGTVGCGVRPVVTLKSDIIDLSKNYDDETGWSLK